MLPSSIQAASGPPGRPTLNERGSSHIGASGLFVLGLGALVLLTGLAVPEAATLDTLSLAGATIEPGSASLPQWLAGAAMVGIALLVIGVRTRAPTLFSLLTTPA